MKTVEEIHNKIRHAQKALSTPANQAELQRISENVAKACRQVGIAAGDALKSIKLK